MLQFIESTFPGQLYPMYAEKIAHNKFHLSPEVPGARVEGEASAQPKWDSTKLAKHQEMPVLSYATTLAAKNSQILVSDAFPTLAICM